MSYLPPFLAYVVFRALGSAVLQFDIFPGFCSRPTLTEDGTRKPMYFFRIFGSRQMAKGVESGLSYGKRFRYPDFRLRVCWTGYLLVHTAKCMHKYMHTQQKNYRGSADLAGSNSIEALSFGDVVAKCVAVYTLSTSPVAP